MYDGGKRQIGKAICYDLYNASGSRIGKSSGLSRKQRRVYQIKLCGSTGQQVISACIIDLFVD
jgi:hypothetical protein